MINQFKKVSIVLAFAALQSCAASPQQAAKLAHLRATVPSCVGAEACKIKWEAAEIWIADNAGYSLRLVTDSVLETYRGDAYSTIISAKVVKRLAGGDRYTIEATVNCNNIFGCVPDVWTAAQNFNDTLNKLN